MIPQSCCPPASPPPATTPAPRCASACLIAVLHCKHRWKHLLASPVGPCLALTQHILRLPCNAGSGHQESGSAVPDHRKPAPRAGLAPLVCLRCWAGPRPRRRGAETGSGAGNRQCSPGRPGIQETLPPVCIGNPASLLTLLCAAWHSFDLCRARCAAPPHSSTRQSFRPAPPGKLRTRMRQSVGRPGLRGR